MFKEGCAAIPILSTLYTEHRMPAWGETLKNRTLDYLHEGDTLVVPSLDRLGGSVRDPSAVVSGLRKRGVGSASAVRTVSA
ncbi:recombinase family protein [Streptomyces sp. YS-3]|uniref:recombinase family protein n=1 Tax=Streptomyces sp. YS-3 TaxID=3381352 RepID=UPI0038628E8D